MGITTKKMAEKTILLDHGSGGTLSRELVDQVFARHFANDRLNEMSDSAILPFPATEKGAASQLAFTTDSYVVQPLFFPGGNIGKLAVCGTLNDLAVSGATPLYLSCGFIIEEGFLISDLEIIVQSMAEEANAAGVAIVTGDTKVVERGACDQLFINTAGVGIVAPARAGIHTGREIQPGDALIINGPIADHGMAIMGKRNALDFQSEIHSDCATLTPLIDIALRASDTIRFMRDATRGGVATVACEVAEKGKLGIVLDEAAIPMNENTRGLCELLGFDPLYVANEGKVVIIVSPDDADRVVTAMRQHPLGTQAAIIGEITTAHPGKVVLHTEVGGTRIVDMIAGAQLPRIC